MTNQGRLYSVADLSALVRDYCDSAQGKWAEQDIEDTREQLTFFLAWIQGRERKEPE